MPRRGRADEERLAQLITVGLPSGEPVQMTRGDWWHMATQSIESRWNDPQILFEHVVQLMNDDFHEDFPDEIVRAAWQVLQTHPQPEFGYSLYAMALRRTGALAEARQTCESYLATHGRSGVMLTNLAQIVAEEGDDARARSILVESIEADPNQELAVEWQFVEVRDREGMGAARAWLAGACDLPGAWMPQITLGHILIREGDVEGATKLYRVAARRCSIGKPLWEIVNMLGASGRPDLAVDLVLPAWRPDEHPADLGLLLVRAALESDRVADARSALNRLEQTQLEFHRQQFDEIRYAVESAEAGAGR